MAESVITIYKQCKITRDRNALVDGIEDYLADVLKTKFEHCQYQKIELNRFIKLELPQIGVGIAEYNYLDVYQDGKHFYYFINKAEWKSTTTVQFDCTLDTINTFNGDFTFNKKTHITRQHKDRIADDTVVNLETYDSETELQHDTLYVLNPDSILTEETFGIYNNDALLVEVRKYENGKLVRTYSNVKRVEQIHDIEYGYNYAISIVYDDSGTTRAVDLNPEELQIDFDNGNYYAFIYEGLPIDFNYSGKWWNLFAGTLERHYRRIIDMQPEEINPPQFKNISSEEDILSNDKQKWYLVYGKNELNVVDCKLYPETVTEVTLLGKKTLDYTDLELGKYYYLMPSQLILSNAYHNKRTFKNGNPLDSQATESRATLNLVIDDVAQDDCFVKCCSSRRTYKDLQFFLQIFNDRDFLYDNGTGFYWSGSAGSFLIMNRDASDNVIVEMYVIYDRDTDSRRKLVKTITIPPTSTFTFIADSHQGWKIYEDVKYNIASTKEVNSRILAEWDKKDSWTPGTWALVDSPNNLIYSFYTLDRTDESLLKIIELPYPLVDINAVPAEVWTYGDNQLSLDRTNGEHFIYTLNPEYNPLEIFDVEWANPNITTNRNDKYESKIYNSEFYIPKFVYDSFNYQYQLENVDISSVSYFYPTKYNEETQQWETVKKENEIEYQVSSTMNSRFLFTFDVPLKRSTSDYDNICVVNRNNELPIYNDSYLNYVRTGYNYDKKNKDANLAKGVAGAVAGGIGGAIATGLAVAKIGAVAGSTVGPIGTAIGAGVGAVVGLATSIIGLAISQSQADESIKRKLDETAQQATSVAGGDDIDLLNTYTNGNKAKYVTYSCSDKVKQTMLDLFYYCGYKEDVREVPDFNSRVWFNFVQCEPVFDEEDCSVYKEYLTDIKARYQEGVTNYHRVRYGPEYRYDWDQEKENWEASLEALD